MRLSVCVCVCTYRAQLTRVPTSSLHYIVVVEELRRHDPRRLAYVGGRTSDCSCMDFSVTSSLS